MSDELKERNALGETGIRDRVSACETSCTNSETGFMLLSHRLTSRVASRHAFRFQGRPHVNPRPNSQRTLVTEAVQRASDGFLDLALALPFPEAIPPYSGTIILLTVATRLFLTVPFSIWVRVLLLVTGLSLTLP